MWSFLDSLRKKKLTAEQLQIVLGVAQQVVLSLEQTEPGSSEKKKSMALTLLRDLLNNLGILAPDSLLDVAIEASVRVLRPLESPTKLQNPFGEITPSGLSKPSNSGGGSL